MNTPTVQELLQDASREVRSTMWDVTALDGPGLAAAWPAFAAHARDALSGVPLPDAGTRLLIHRAAGPRYRPNRWGPPVDAQLDPHLVRASQAMAAVADLLTRYAAPPTSMEAGHDAALARRRIAECLLVGSHATALGLSEHAARLQPARAGLAFERSEARLAVKGATLAQSRRLASELATFEAHLSHYLARPVEREQRDAAQEFADPDRLPLVLAQWEDTAMRVLHAQPPSVRDLAGIAHTEQALLVHTLVILNAAARSAVINPEDFDRQIRPRLENSQTGWGDVAANWPAQMTTPAPPSLAGVQASAQLHQALGQITRDGNGWATPALIASRVHLAEVVVLLRDTVAASGGRAERFAELPSELAHARHLHAPARLFAAMESHANGRGFGSESAVRITDVANRRIVVVRPEQTKEATMTACDLRRQLTSLTAAIGTLPPGRQSQAVVEPASGAQAAFRDPSGRTGTGESCACPECHGQSLAESGPFSGDRALHLTGVVLVMASPGAGSAGAVDAGRVPGRSGRPWRRLAWLVSFDQLLVADRVVTDGELEYSQEDQAAAA